MDAATLVMGLFPLRIFSLLPSRTRYFFIGLPRGSRLDGSCSFLFVGPMGSGSSCKTAQRLCQQTVHPGRECEL